MGGTKVIVTGGARRLQGIGGRRALIGVWC